MSEQTKAGTYSMESTEETILEVRNASVTFGMDRGESRVLDDVSIDIRRNEILGIVGESGSGKSMFADSLLDAVVDPGVLNGEIIYHDNDGSQIEVNKLEKDALMDFRWEHIAMVFQGAMSSFNPTITIRAHFIDTLEAHDMNEEEGLERARELLSELHLTPERVLDSYPHELSGGMKQRVLIALSLLLEPDVLVMDEPTAALDLLMQRSIISLISKLKERYDLTIIFITHDLPLIANLADRLAVMYAFNFVEVGPADRLLRNPAHPYTRALIKSTPNLDSPLDDMKPISGSSPDPVNIPSGCSYHPRCPLSDEHCEAVDPGVYRVDSTHGVNCHYWEKTEDAIPITFDDTPEPTREIGDDQKIQSRQEDPVLSINDLEVHFEVKGGIFDFSENETVRAVDGVSLDVFENDVLVVVGESGCGKTTLGKAAIGVQRPTAGSIEYRDTDIWDARDRHNILGRIFNRSNGSSSEYIDIRRSLQMVHQDPASALNSYKKVQNILAEPLKEGQQDLNSSDRRERILSMLKYVGMTPPEDYAQRYPHQLSGGEKQRVALIRSMFMNPDVILADEAVSALDVSLRVEMMDLMLELQNLFNTSYIFISHNLSNARYIAKKSDGRIAVMYLGKIVEIGTPEQIINDPRHPYTKSLVWATPELDPDAEQESENPLRKIDIPDPTHPPEGCQFHTRCPEAREACVTSEPTLIETNGDSIHQASCFREYEDHEYWSSEPLPEDE